MSGLSTATSGGGGDAATMARNCSYGSLQQTGGTYSSIRGGADCRQNIETITLLHEQPEADTRPLLLRPQLFGPHPNERDLEGEMEEIKGARATNTYTSHLEQEFYGYKATNEEKRRRGGFGHFRFVVGALIIFAVTMNTYANYTLYIAAIEMISNDVLQSGMTELRAKHMWADPLAVNTNAASPGTCPKEMDQRRELFPSIFQSLSTSQVNNQELNLKPKLNASQLSSLERLAMQVEASALLTSVQERLANGQLVDWSISQRGYIFTAHNIGGILWAVPISRLGLIYGSKIMIFLCTLITGIRMLLLPLLAGHSPFWATFAFELLLGGPGASIGILAYPMASVWLLPDEANFFVALSQLFVLAGTAATNFISTQLLANQIAWCWCYYLPGAILCALALLWLILGADRPSESRFVSREELALLAQSMANRNQTKIFDANQTMEHSRIDSNQQSDYVSCFCQNDNKRLKCPALQMRRQPNWRTIFTCPTIWALIAVYFAYHWNAKIATLWPTYFANMLHMEPSTIGLITGLKGVVALVFGSAFAFATRKLVVKRPFGWSLTAYRRVNQVLATLVLALSVALMVALDCDLWANLISVLLTPIVTSFNAISHEQMPLDLSAEDSGLLVSVIRLLSIGDIVALPVSSYVLSFAPDALAGDRATWRLVWLLGLAVKALTCLLFVLMAKSQPKSYSRLVAAGPCKSSAFASNNH